MMTRNIVDDPLTEISDEIYQQNISCCVISWEGNPGLWLAECLVFHQI